MPHWLLKAQSYSQRLLEVVLAAFLLVVASRYWVISEHVAYISLFAATGLIALFRGFEGAFSVRRFLPLIAFGLFIGWIVLSSTWSPNFHLSFGRAVTVGLVAAIGVAIGFALKPSTIAQGFLLGVLFHVGHATFTDGLGLLGFLALGDGPGLFTNISDMTFLLGVGAVSALWVGTKWPTLALFSLPMIVFLLVTGWGIPVLTMFFAVAAAFAVGLMLAHLRLSSDRTRNVWRIVYPVSVLIGGLSFWLFREPLLRPLGVNPDLSGRTIIWNWFFEAFLWEPVIGIGWGNSYNLPVTRGDTFPSGGYFIAHNGFLDIGLVTGGVGVILIVATLVMVFLRGSSLALNRAKSFSYLFMPSLVTYLVFNDIMATSLPRYIGVFLVGTMVGLIVSEPLHFDVRKLPPLTGKGDSALRPERSRESW